MPVLVVPDRQCTCPRRRYQISLYIVDSDREDDQGKFPEQECTNRGLLARNIEKGSRCPWQAHPRPLDTS